MRSVRATFAFVLLLIPLAAVTQSSTPTVTEPLPPTPGIKMEVLSLPTAVTGEYADMLRKLGQQGEPLMALLYYPKGVSIHSVQGYCSIMAVSAGIQPGRWERPGSPPSDSRRVALRS